MKQIEVNRADVAASFQYAVIDVLTTHAIHAVKESGMDKLAIAGGVASNSALRKNLQEACEKEGIQFYHQSPIYNVVFFCTLLQKLFVIFPLIYFPHFQKWKAKFLHKDKFFHKKSLEIKKKFQPLTKG